MVHKYLGLNSSILDNSKYLRSEFETGSYNAAITGLEFTFSCLSDPNLGVGSHAYSSNTCDLMLRVGSESLVFMKNVNVKKSYSTDIEPLLSVGV